MPSGKLAGNAPDPTDTALPTDPTKRHLSFVDHRRALSVCIRASIRRRLYQGQGVVMREIGGFLIQFDEEERTALLTDIVEVEGRFSDALSSSDWSIRQWEVCGLLFEPGIITHWALAQRTRRVATRKIRVEFTNLSPTHIPLTRVERRVASRFRHYIVRVRSGIGGRVPPRTWHEMKQAIGEIEASSLEALERLERMRDEAGERINRLGARIVAQQRDATGLALDVLDRSGRVRRRVLGGWTPPDGDRSTSFLDGLAHTHVVEDQVIARDTAYLPGLTKTRVTIVGAVFSLHDRSVEVFNVNRTRIEESLGVDLLYFNETFGAWTMVQYKIMNESLQYRPDQSLDRQLEKMQGFRADNPDMWKVESGPSSYRLCGDGFYFKLCRRVHLEVSSEKLLPGMYLPRQFMEAILTDSSLRGPRGGRIVTTGNTERYLNNTLFVDLLRAGWIGTRGVSSSRIGEIVTEALAERNSVVIARGRPRRSGADLNETLDELGLSRLAPE